MAGQVAVRLERSLLALSQVGSATMGRRARVITWVLRPVEALMQLPYGRNCLVALSGTPAGCYRGARICLAGSWRI